LQEANVALCAGQAQEIAFQRDGSIGPDAYLAMIGAKAALFAVACELGALVAGATPERTQAYARLGRTCGMAFQMEDLAYLAEGDALASATGIDRSGRVRAFIARAIRPAA
jgi:geranylgeranyl pyrophosphate synthase